MSWQYRVIITLHYMQYLFMNLIHGPHFMADSRVVLDSVIGKADGIHCKYHFPNT